jgi:hypothetical protein
VCRSTWKPSLRDAFHRSPFFRMGMTPAAAKAGFHTSTLKMFARLALPYVVVRMRWTGSETWDNGVVTSAPHPAHTKTNKCPPGNRRIVAARLAVSQHVFIRCGNGTCHRRGVSTQRGRVPAAASDYGKRLIRQLRFHGGFHLVLSGSRIGARHGPEHHHHPNGTGEQAGRLVANRPGRSLAYGTGPTGHVLAGPAPTRSRTTDGFAPRPGENWLPGCSPLSRSPITYRPNGTNGCAPHAVACR